jgi:transposase
MSRPKKTTSALPVLNAHAAGVDIGATQIFVAVPQDSDPQAVRSFHTFTTDLNALADWLHQSDIQTVALESTGVYWIPLYQILEARGFEVCLVNARHLHNVPGHKTDVCDSQWLQYLHACGLLRASFRPEQAVCAVRSLLRHRENLVRYAGAHIQHVQKALTQMNVLLHHVISDLTGKTGLAILDAILAGERDPHKLAQYRDPRIKASPETIAKSLVGDYRPEHLFALKQALSAYRHYQHLLAECDGEIERMLSQFESRIDQQPPSSEHPDDCPQPSPRSTSRKPARGNVLEFKHADLNTELYRLYGTDLTRVPALGALTLYTLFAEVGRDLSAFPSDKHFTSWLGLCPGNKVSGGKVLSSHTNRVSSRAARAFRMAAQSLWHNQSHLGDYYRRMCARLGKPAAVTATAHKLARIFYHLVITRQPYDESIFAQEQARLRQRRERRLRREAERLGFQLVPHQGVT